MLDVRIAPIPGLRRLIDAHPETSFEGTSENSLIEWQGAHGPRRIVDSDLSLEVGGLIEIMDNNPLVCASEAYLPNAAATLALIALGPAIRASLFRDTPVVAFSFDGNIDIVEGFLAKEGWTDGCAMHCEPLDSGSVLAAKAMVEIEHRIGFTEVVDLYEEAFGRSFFVQRDQGSSWSPLLVAGTPIAVYRLDLERDEQASLLKIQVIADEQGKCGAGQAIHMFNVMNGFEESLGFK